MEDNVLCRPGETEDYTGIGMWCVRCALGVLGRRARHKYVTERQKPVSEQCGHAAQCLQCLKCMVQDQGGFAVHRCIPGS